MRTADEIRAQVERNAAAVVLSQMRDHMRTATQGAAFWRGRNDSALEEAVADYWDLLAYAVEGGLIEQLVEERNREGQPTILDVMTAEELAEADREAEARLDAEAGAWHAEGAPF